jgi:hypothetical protein
MGMFDTLHINPSLLPLTEVEDYIKLSKETYQTKSLERLLLTFRITEDGYLEYKDTYSETSPYNWSRVMNFNGIVIFYTSIDEPYERFEFVATFIDGQLSNIVRHS